MDSNKALEATYNIIANANYKIYRYWFTDIVFTWRWWVGVVLTILPWIVWTIIKDKNNTARLLFVGLVASLVATTLDNVGIAFGLWYYHYNVTPFFITLIPWDLSLFPVGIMLILQIKPNINKYIKALLFAFFTSFVFEPFFVWIGMYQTIHYKCWYSFFVYVPLYLFFYFIYKSKLCSAQLKLKKTI